MFCSLFRFLCLFEIFDKIDINEKQQVYNQIMQHYEYQLFHSYRLFHNLILILPYCYDCKSIKTLFYTKKYCRTECFNYIKLVGY